MITKELRLKKATDFSKTYKFGQSYNHPELYIKSLKTGYKTSKFAVVIPKKVAKLAVKRNRARRRVYEIIRVNQPNIAGGYNIIITLKSDLSSLTPSKLTEVLLKGLQKLGITK
ncbi:MAG: Ribonuclease protein component [Patescibacteria group bacterium]|nr:Ribonuclease protein component [Patescibacteria group bacterium]